MVLLQSGKGGGLAAEFGGTSSSSESFLGGRQAASLLTRASWVTGGVFLGLSLILTILSARTLAPTSVLESQFRPATTQQEVPTSILQREQQGEAAAGSEESGIESEEGSGQQDKPPPKSER